MNLDKSAGIYLYMCIMSRQGVLAELSDSDAGCKDERAASLCDVIDQLFNEVALPPALHLMLHV